MSKAVVIYGTLPERLGDPDSFASQIERMHQARCDSGLALSKLISVPETASHSVLMMLFEHPEDRQSIVTALNFGRGPVKGIVQFPEPAGQSAKIFYSTRSDETEIIQISENGDFVFELEASQGVVYMVG